MKNYKIVLSVIALLTASYVGAHEHQAKTSEKALQDGEIMIPNNYQQWPVFKRHIEKIKGEQVRDIYINTKGAKSKKGEAFPAGTQFVMDLYSAKKDENGKLLRENGKLVKGSLSKIFVMEKGLGWEGAITGSPKNGDWVYSAYNGDGSKAQANYQVCRGCHLPKAEKDYIFHYDEYFKKSGY